jgi:hypothetical protein
MWQRRKHRAQKTAEDVAWACHLEILIQAGRASALDQSVPLHCLLGGGGTRSLMDRCCKRS